MPYNGGMTKWRDCMPSAELAAGQVVELSWEGEDLLLYRTTAGECHTLAAYCPHMGNYIPNGVAAGESISVLLRDAEIHCPFHGWCFDALGRCTHIPPGQRVPEAVRKGRAVARTWPVREKRGQIQLALA